MGQNGVNFFQMDSQQYKARPSGWGGEPGADAGGGVRGVRTPPPPRPLPLLYHVRRVHLTSLLHRMHMATKRTSSILSFFSKRSKGKFCSVILFRT